MRSNSAGVEMITPMASNAVLATGIEVCVTYSATKELLLFGDCLFNCGDTVENKTNPL